MDLNRSSFIAGFFLCLLMVGCAGFTFKYYGLAEVNYEQGKLLGPKASEDLPFSTCSPTQTNAHPCVVMMTTDFFALKLDYEDLQQKLKACEKK